MTIVLYNSTAEKEVLNKSGYLTQVSTLTGTLRKECNIVDPRIIVELDTLPNFNYAYIPEFNRYYFLTDVTSVNNKLWEISLHCDVLFSHMNGIMGLTCDIGRNEFEYDLLLSDDLRTSECTYDVEIHELEDGDNLFSIPDNNIDLMMSHSLVLNCME